MNKHIFIHVGPAKTGSSAIQKFLQENPVLLSELGIMYPGHTLMESGVSVGNYNTIYDRNTKGKPSTNKIAKLISTFEKSEAKILLLSSENFFGPIHELAKAIPEAKFIFYLRNPLTLAESLYNQNVKNFGETEPFEIKTRRPNFGIIGHLRDFAKNHGTKNLVVRYFDKKMFYRGNIINDLLATVGVDNISTIPQQKVNLSYTLEALEVKRFLNNFTLDFYCDYKLDNLLQQNEYGQSNYSFLDPNDFAKHLRHVEDELTGFFKEIPCENSDEFLKTVRETKQKEYTPQDIGDDEFCAIRNFIYQNNSPLYYQLCNLILNQSLSTKPLHEKALLFMEKYSANPAVRAQKKAQFQMDKMIFINKLRLKRFLP